MSEWNPNALPSVANDKGLTLLPIFMSTALLAKHVEHLYSKPHFSFEALLKIEAKRCRGLAD